MEVQTPDTILVPYPMPAVPTPYVKHATPILSVHVHPDSAAFLVTAYRILHTAAFELRLNAAVAQVRIPVPPQTQHLVPMNNPVFENCVYPFAQPIANVPWEKDASIQLVLKSAFMMPIVWLVNFVKKKMKLNQAMGFV